ncbi:Cysteine-rich domain, DPF-motif [Cinara cedri]|uniref:Cysteine-rich DPF motif domain-containing protein 1 n=1 Tax=Cinara cedri TaxID=506608 RepID=A0A5E4MUG4_9HEMI|nr:Cysteine-rich domain, DPF-motif [Cinara cedri]
MSEGCSSEGPEFDQVLYIDMLKDLMSVKNEHPLNLNTKIKIEITDDDDTKSQEKKSDLIKSEDIEPLPSIEERPIFQCKNCRMTEQYDCFGDHVLFNRNVRTKVDCYLAKDPFSSRNKRQFLILGSVCSVCDIDVCIKPECSIFFSKIFCSVCARKNITDFPLCIQEKIKTAKRI